MNIRGRRFETDRANGKIAGVCAGLGRVPLVGIHPGEGHPRREGDVLRHVPIVVAMGLGESALVLQRREPVFQEVGAEGDDVLRGREIVGRQLVGTEGAEIGSPQRLVREGLVANYPAPCGGSPFGQEIGESAAAGARDHRDLPGGAAQLPGEGGDRFIPRHILEAAVRLTGLGPGKPSRVVQSLKC